MKYINKIVLGIALSCIAIGATISILGIWGFIGDTGLIWRSLSTLGVVFLATVLTFTVNSMVSAKSKEER